MNSLSDKQQEMRARQKKEPRLGRPHKMQMDPKTQRRIAALILLQSGRSPESVAAAIGVDLPMLQHWIERGMPVIGDYPERGLSLD